MEAIGFVGLGMMGGRMARRLLGAGYPLFVYDIRHEAMEKLTDLGATAAASAMDLGTKCDVVITMLPDSNAVEEAVIGEQGASRTLRRGSVVIDTSSAYPQSTARISKILREKGVDMLDAPVSGGQRGAEAGTLSLMVGGDKRVFERCMPILTVVGDKDKIQHIGPIGSGHATKVINNYNAAVHRICISESLILATKMGLPIRRLADVISATTGKTTLVEHFISNCILRGIFTEAMATRLMCKDVDHFCRLAKEFEVSTFLTGVVDEFYRYAVYHGMGDVADYGVVKVLEEWNGVEVRDPDVVSTK